MWKLRYAHPVLLNCSTVKLGLTHMTACRCRYHFCHLPYRAVRKAFTPHTRCIAAASCLAPASCQWFSLSHWVGCVVQVLDCFQACMADTGRGTARWASYTLSSQSADALPSTEDLRLGATQPGLINGMRLLLSRSSVH